MIKTAFQLIAFLSLEKIHPMARKISKPITFIAKYTIIPPKN